MSCGIKTRPDLLEVGLNDGVAALGALAHVELVIVDAVPEDRVRHDEVRTHRLISTHRLMDHGQFGSTIEQVVRWGSRWGPGGLLSLTKPMHMPSMYTIQAAGGMKFAIKSTQPYAAR